MSGEREVSVERVRECEVEWRRRPRISREKEQIICTCVPVDDRGERCSETKKSEGRGKKTNDDRISVSISSGVGGQRQEEESAAGM